MPFTWRAPLFGPAPAITAATIDATMPTGWAPIASGILWLEDAICRLFELWQADVLEIAGRRDGRDAEVLPLEGLSRDRAQWEVDALRGILRHTASGIVWHDIHIRRKPAPAEEPAPAKQPAAPPAKAEADPAPAPAAPAKKRDRSTEPGALRVLDAMRGDGYAAVKAIPPADRPKRYNAAKSLVQAAYTILRREAKKA
jgi:hypothetical protein